MRNNLHFIVFILGIIFLMNSVTASTPGDISGCQTLDTAGVYNLTQNVTSAGTCFTITANNVTLDCGGNSITYDTGVTSFKYGVYAYKNYTVVRDCVMVQTGSATNCNAINFAEVFYGIIQNNTLTTNGGTTSHPITLDKGSYNLIDSNVMISPMGGIGMGSNGVPVVSYNNISNNNITSTGSTGAGVQILGTGASFNRVVGNRILLQGSSGGYGLRINNPDNVFVSNIINSTSTNGDAIYLTPGAYNELFSDNVITTSGGSADGVYFSDTALGNNFNITFLRMNITTLNSTTAYAINLFRYGANFNVIDSILNSASIEFLISASNNAGGEFNFTNVTRPDGSAPRIDWKTNGIGTLNQMWYVNASANYTNGTKISGINISGFDVNNVSRYINSTDSDGNARLTLLELSRSGSAGGAVVYFSNYTINATSPVGSAASSVFNLTGNINKFLTFLWDAISPLVDFIAPTLSANAITNANSVYVNISSSDNSGNHSTFVDWNNSLVSWWKLEQGNGTFFVDQVGRNNGSCSGVVCPSYSANGSRGGMYNFDGADDYVQIPDSNSLDVGNVLTISAWVKVTNVSARNNIYSSSNNNTANASWFEVGTSGTSYINGVSASISGWYVAATSDAAAPVNQNNAWYHVVYTRNASGANTHAIYVNGANQPLKLSSALGYLDNSVPKLIGGRTNSTQLFNGSIDDVILFNRSLSAQEVSALYNAQVNQYRNNFTNLTNGNYTFKAYSQDLAGNVNITELRTVTVDLINSSVNLTSPTNNTFTNNGTQNFTANISDNIGIKNATLNVVDMQNKWLNFDGVNDNVDLGTSSSYNISSDGGAISAWVNRAGGRVIVGQGQEANSRNGYYLEYNTNLGGLVFVVANATGSSVASGGILTNNVWYHVIGTWNSTTNFIYLNGVLIRNVSKSTDMPTYSPSYKGLKLGVYPNFAGDFLNGSMDEVRIFNRTLSQSEITALYNNRLTANSTFGNTSGLIAYYDFQNSDGNATRLVDMSGTGNNGTIIGGANFTSTYTSTTTNSPGVLSQTIGTVVSLVDGIYNWFYSIFDLAGNVYNTANNILTIDTIFPAYTFTSPTSGAYYNTANISFAVSTTSAPNASIIPNIDNSLVSWYRMDETNSSGTKVVDYMNRNNGTAINGATQVTNGKFGDAWSFNGSQYVDITTYDFTGAPFAFGMQNIAGVYKLYTYYVDGWSSGYNSNLIAYQNWGMYTAVLDGANSKVRIYSNGIEVGNYTKAGTANRTFNVWAYAASTSLTDRNRFFDRYTSGSFRIGIYSGSPASTGWNGSLDDAMIFNRSLSADEILSLYNATAYNHYENLSGQGNHTFNSYIQDFAGNINTTGQITFTIDTTNATANLLTPINNTFTNQTAGINLTANLTDNIGIKNATLNIINTTDNSLTQTVIDVTSGSVQQTVGVVVNLVEGIYNWFINIFDLAGNQYNSQNSTLIIDTTYPLIEFDSSSPINETGTPDVFNLTILINETNIANVTLYFNSTNYYFDFTNNASYFTLVSGNQYNFSVEKGPLGNIEQIYYNLTIIDKAGNSNSTETRLIRGNTPPSLISLSQTPSDNETLDPLVEVFVNATLLDTQSNFATAWLEWKNSTQDWSEANRILMTTNGSTDFVFVNASFVLPYYEDKIQYRIFTNDSVGSSANLSVYNISNYWDCSWTATSDLGGKAGYSEAGLLGYLIVNNTGDSSYADGCTLTFKSQHNLDSGKIYLNSSAKSTIYSLTPGAIKNISTSYVFGTDMKSDPYIITTSETSEVTSVYQINTTGIAVTNQKGPYLYQSISPYLAPVYIKPEIFSITSYISNLMGSDVYNESNTAFNVSYDWEISPVFTNATGNLTGLFENMSDSNEHSLDLGINATDWQTIRQGVYSFTLNSSGKDLNGDLINDTNNNSNFASSINISFLCYQVSDGFDAKGCWPLDPDTVYCGNGKIDSSINETCSSCPQDAGACPTIVSTGGSGGGGGSGNEFAKSEATFELVRGEKQEFILTLENKLAVAKKNITIKISGDNSGYVTTDPEVIKYIGPNSAVNITVKITAPSYFAADRHLLRFDFAGDTIVNSTSVRFTEQKFVTLRILDISRSEINRMMNSSTSIISEMNSSGFIIRGVEDLYTQMQTNYENYSFADLKTNYQQLDLIYKSAIDSNKSIEEVRLDIADAEKRGLTVSETKKLLYLAEIIFKRGDYVLAAEKLREARLTFALETKGEFKLLYAIKNNPGESTGVLVSAFLIAIGSSYVVRLRLLKRKLRVLAEEEQLLLQLMKVIQRDCFEGGKMAVEEYNEAMLQYERRLGEVIQERIRAETLLANLMRVNGNKNALAQEKARLISLIRTAQEDYLNKGKIETRVYENMLKTYGSRLSKIEEERVFSEAQEAIRKVTGWRFFRKK